MIQRKWKIIQLHTRARAHTVLHIINISYALLCYVRECDIFVLLPFVRSPRRLHKSQFVNTHIQHQTYIWKLNIMWHTQQREKECERLEYGVKNEKKNFNLIYSMIIILLRFFTWSHSFHSQMWCTHRTHGLCHSPKTHGKTVQQFMFLE